ncbi:ATP-binding protein [Streptomyces sp. NBC_01373]|nr:ATP-binding protein [Streptomyces sp. NBC_01373]
MAEPRSLQVRYRRYRPSVPIARAKARLVAKEWCLPPHVADSLEWVVTELVTNAVIHGRATRGSRVLVAYHLEDDLLRVDVRDAASGMPRVRPSSNPDGEAATGGRGLQIVSTLADSWGVTPRVIGKSVWVELAVSVREAAS